LALLWLIVHLITTPPSYAAVQPATSAELQLAAAKGLEVSQATQQPVALIELTDAEATTLLRESISASSGLSDMEVHVLPGKIVLTGQTTLLSHPLVISGIVKLSAAGSSQVDLKFRGVWIGQLGLPGLVPNLLTKGLHPRFNLALAAGGQDPRFACADARQDDLVVGVLYGSGQDPTADQACSQVS